MPDISSENNSEIRIVKSEIRNLSDRFNEMDKKIVILQVHSENQTILITEIKNYIKDNNELTKTYLRTVDVVSRHTSEIAVAQSTANKSKERADVAIEDVKDLKRDFDSYKESKEKEENDGEKRLAPWKMIIFNVLATIITIVIVGVLALLGLKQIK